MSKLGKTEYDMSPHWFEFQHRHVFHLELSEAAPARWASQENHDGKQEPTHFEFLDAAGGRPHPSARPGRPTGASLRLITCPRPGAVRPSFRVLLV
ncbi:hypothetical protein [Streptomyces sp. NPDC047042]|uniref:hypothetical protein n=1 Tax=Streptomyces sp. NPDC047042 TaxID=3154807 RepID=UPI0033E977D1